MNRIITEGIELVIFEPTHDGSKLIGSTVTSNQFALKSQCDPIILNGKCRELDNVEASVFTRNILAPIGLS